MKHNKNYKSVEMDKAEFDRWPSTFIAENLLNGMGRVINSSMEDNAKSGATEDLDSSEIVGDIPRTVSGIVDVNNVLEPYETGMLSDLTSLTENVTINVVTGNTINNHSRDLLGLGVKHFWLSLPSSTCPRKKAGLGLGVKHFWLSLPSTCIYAI